MKTVLRLLLSLICLSLIHCTRHSDTTSNSAGSESVESKIKKAEDNLKATPSFENYVSLGLLYSSNNQAELALKYFEKSLEVSPNSPVAYNNICAEQNSLKRWALSVPNCEKAVQLQPDFELAKNNLAFAKASLAEAQKQILEVSKNADPKNKEEAELQVGLLYNESGEYKVAIEHWNHISSKSKLYAAAQNNIASASIQIKDYAAAKKSIQTALTLEPDNQLFKNNLQWLEDAQKSK